ncbi:hypothetical protein DUZ99_01070 [Xylanibacillus composti]|uniref:Uncharacterized protein n=1 Tax=Xylanibacillus composti TaxID=1572762 RepID=A0A8J4H2N3_9BACL|nr:hypothetical protein [Xylanibacillus composti]MDT9723608.1 hypothetical protein [Xylanibacillus composti]GIQ68351.1 hypothetical protein XYCOK13_11750 [Xylanibacillus composti]
MSRPESSIWGNILTCFEIGLHVYGIFAEKNSGIALDANYAKEVLSEKALQAGEVHGEHVYYDDVKSAIPAYELLKQGAITDPEFKKYCGSTEQLAEEGKFFAPEYFGEFSAPSTTPLGTVTDSQFFHNGLYLLESGGKWHLAVNQIIAKQCLSDFAHQLAAGHDDYLYYPLDACAVPIYELSASHPAVAEQLVSDDSLAHTLCEDYPVYVAIHNLHTEEWGHIHDSAAPKSLFLQIQLDQAVTGEEPNHRHVQVTYETDKLAAPFQVREPDDFFEPSGELEL